MQKNINLYTALPKKPAQQLTTLLMMQIYGGCAGILLLIFLLQIVHFFILKMELSYTNSSYVSAAVKLAQLNTLYPLGTKNDQMKVQIQTFKSNMLAEQTLFNAILQETAQSNKFSSDFVSLAKNIIPGVWLTEIQIDKSEQQIYLQGQAISPIAIVQFFQKLNQSPNFTGKPFMLFKLNNAEDKSGNLNFVLGTHAKENLAGKPS